MNERTTNDFLSKETAEMLPSESRRRELLLSEISDYRRELSRATKELNEFLNSPLCSELFNDHTDLNDEQVMYYLALYNKVDELKSEINSRRRTIERLDAGETLADIYKSIFGGL